MERTGPKKKLNETSVQLKQQNIETVMITNEYLIYSITKISLNLRG